MRHPSHINAERLHPRMQAFGAGGMDLYDRRGRIDRLSLFWRLRRQLGGLLCEPDLTQRVQDEQ